MMADGQTPERRSTPSRDLQGRIDKDSHHGIPLDVVGEADHDTQTATSVAMTEKWQHEISRKSTHMVPQARQQ